VMDRIMTIGQGGAPCNVTQLNFGAHTGTHLDAPLHFIKDGNGVEKLDLDVLIGPALLVEVADDVDMVTRKTLEELAIPAGTERLLIRSRNSVIWATDPEDFDETFVAISPCGARWIVEQGIKLVGVDYLSVAPFRDDYSIETHVILLEAGVIPVEGLNLAEVDPGQYQLACLPIKIEGCDGAPCRTVLIEE
jgi:arylformamidase